MAAVTWNDLRRVAGAELAPAVALVENVRHLALPTDLREAWGNEPVVRIDR
jgi:hypothetical protein